MSIDARLAELLASKVRLESAQLAELEQLARKLGPDVESMPVHDTDGSRWLRASYLESAKRYSEAAAILEGIWEGCRGEHRAIRLLASARNLCPGTQRELTARRLSEATRNTFSNRTLTAIDRVWKQLRTQELPAKRRCRIALLGSITLDFWLPALRAQCLASGLDAEFLVGPFGQTQQEILNPNSKTAAFKPDIIVLAGEGPKSRLPEESADPVATVEYLVSEHRALWRHAREHLGAFVIQVNAEIPAHDPWGHLGVSMAGGHGRMLRAFNLRLWEAAQEETGVAILDLDQAAAKFGKLQWLDPVLWNAAKQYPSTPAIPTLTHHIAALFRAVVGLSAKCVAVDLDGTLWGGVIGEDGIGGIQIGGGPVGEAHAAFQRYLKSLASRGILLAACSKNNLEDALLPFREHREMVLKETDFAVFVANWETKDRNIREIAQKLNIGLDAIVFVDDNPMERGRVRQNVPEVEVVEMPADPSGFVAALDTPLYFEGLTLTHEDRVRGQSIRENQERASLQSNAASVDDYLADLQMSVELSPFQPADMARIVQLINKTNQFNMTTRRTTDAEIQQWAADPNCYTQSLRVADRFGDSGLTGVLIAVREGDAFRIHTWLMSCRVMGRRLEEAVLAALLAHARSVGAIKIIGEYIPTAKNNVVAELYAQLGFQPTGKEGFFERPAALEMPDLKFLRIDDRTNPLTAASTK